MNQSEQPPTPEELKGLENDTVWALIEEATPAKASPAFLSHVMEQAEQTVQMQSESPSSSDDKIITSPSFWQRYAVPIGGIAVAGIAACVMLVFNTHDDISTSVASSTASDTVETPTIELTEAELVALAVDEGFPLDSLVASHSETDQLDQLIALDDEDPLIMSAEDINVLVSM